MGEEIEWTHKFEPDFNNRCVRCGRFSTDSVHLVSAQWSKEEFKKDMQRGVVAPNYERLQLVDWAMRRFTDAMRYKMLLNAHKGRWNYSFDDAITKMKREIEELDAAIQTKNIIEIVLELADVANFAMIASAIAVEKGLEDDSAKTTEQT